MDTSTFRSQGDVLSPKDRLGSLQDVNEALTFNTSNDDCCGVWGLSYFEDTGKALESTMMGSRDGKETRSHAAAMQSIMLLDMQKER